MTQSGEGFELANDVLSVAQQPTIDSTASHETRVPFAPYTRLAIVTGILLPIGIIPYLLARRRITGLQRRIDELESKLIGMEKQINNHVLETKWIRSEQLKTRTMLSDIMENMDRSQQETIQQTVEQKQVNRELQLQIQKQLMEVQHTTGDKMRNLGVSLGELAGFVDEVEKRTWLKKSGRADRLRVIGQRVSV